MEFCSQAELSKFNELEANRRFLLEEIDEIFRQYPTGVALCAEDIIKKIRKYQEKYDKKISIPNEQERATAKKWKKQHRLECQGRIKLEKYLTGVGIGYELKCSCGKKKDITDYASW